MSKEQIQLINTKVPSSSRAITDQCLRLGDRYTEKGDWPLGLQFYEIALAHWPQHPPGSPGRPNAYAYGLKEVGAAFNGVWKLRHYANDELNEHSNFKEALPYGEVAVAMAEKIYPQDSDQLGCALTVLGTSKASLNQCAEAIPLLEKAEPLTLKLFPKYANYFDTLWYLGYSYEATGQFDKARQAYGKLLELRKQYFTWPDINQLSARYDRVSKRAESAAGR